MGSNYSEVIYKSSCMGRERGREQLWFYPEVMRDRKDSHSWKMKVYHFMFMEKSYHSWPVGFLSLVKEAGTATLFYQGDVASVGGSTV